MELSSPESIRSLIAATAQASQVRRRGSTSGLHSGRRRRCQCGHCRECVDNARWERIFAEKFADPDYYTRSGVRAESPLMSL